MATGKYVVTFPESVFGCYYVQQACSENGKFEALKETTVVWTCAACPEPFSHRVLDSVEAFEQFQTQIRQRFTFYSDLILRRIHNKHN